MDESQNGGPWKWHIEETYKSLVPLSIEALKILALANGGACVALLTFCGNLASKGQSPLIGSFRLAITSYCSGLASTMLAFLFTYWTQLRHYNEEKQRHEGRPPKELYRWLVAITGLLAAFAVGAFIYGSLRAADVIEAPAAGAGTGLSPK
jgi:phosphate/sulfate permease